MKNLIPKSFIQDIVARTDIVSLIATRIELKKRGGTHVACCPFHHEKTPSFTVSQSKQFYYCFGCGAHGNVIGFLMAYDHLSFVDTITDLANQLGMQVPLEINREEKSQQDTLYALLHQAQALYEKELKNSPTAIAYLKKRGLTGAIAKTFGLGYAPNAWDFLTQTLGKNRTDRELLTTAGMLISKENRHYDRFRDRILFPIRDPRGRMIGFGGRTLTDEIPKYLNSPETPIFHKNATLYGLYEMTQHHRTVTRALVVEGYLDVISLSQHNIHNVVATLGTALNIKHIQLLLRYTSTIIFCFDGDNAGKKAAWKALTICLPLLRDGLDFRFLFLPDSEDPDSLVQKIKHDAFERLIDNATALSQVFFDELEKMHSTNTIAGKAAFAKQAQDYLNTMPQGIYKNLLLEQLAKYLEIKRDTLADQQPAVTTHAVAVNKQNKLSNASKKNTQRNLAQIAIQLLLHEPMLAAHIKQLPNISVNEKTPEKTLLMYLIKRCQENTYSHFGDLLEDIEDTHCRETLVKIATQPLSIPDNGRLPEFIGALERLYEQDQAHQLNSLIQKAKQAELNAEEKQLLQLLLVRNQVHC